MTFSPPDETQAWQRWLKQGMDSVQSGQSSQAIEKLEKANRARPGSEDVQYWLANAYRMDGQFARAETLFKALIPTAGDPERATFGLAFLLRDQGRLAEAESVLMQLTRQEAGTRERCLRVAGFLRDINRIQAAISLMQDVVNQAPEDATSRFRLARLYQASGDFDGALRQLRVALSKDPNLGGAWISLAHLQKFRTGDEPDLALIRSAEGRLGDEESRICHGFALAKASDDLGDYGSAWDAWVKANERAAERFNWNPEAWSRFVRQRLNSARAPARTDEFPGEGTAVYIVGMLRSGTTLLEQRLGAYPGVRPRGELNFLAHFDRQPGLDASSGQALWSHLRQGDSSSRVFIDKNPLNFRYLDTLHALLPAARVVHIQRDGRNSCLSCFMQLFQHPDSAFANRLEDILHFYRGYRQLMAHWRSSYPEWMHEVRYEDLVCTTQETLDSVMTFVSAGTPATTATVPDENASVRTASAWQARQSIYRSSLERWKNYREFAPDFFDQIVRIDEQYPVG